MSIDLLVRETLERELADIPVPRCDLDRIRRAGRGRRRARVGGGLAAIVALVGASTAIVVLNQPQPDPAATTTDVPAMDFSAGLRGLFDATRGQTMLGGQTFDLGAVQDLGDSAAPTPYGLVYFAEDQSTRLLPADGRVRTLAAAPVRPAADFTPTIRYDPARGQAAWLTRGAGGVTLSIYAIGDRLRLSGSFDVPCAGESCEALAIAGFDQGMVFVRGENGTRAFEPALGQRAAWLQVTDSRLTDVRNRVILTADPTDPDATALPFPLNDGTWRVVAAATSDALLTFDGLWQVGSTTLLLSTLPGGPSVALPLDVGTGPVSLNLDSDGSVLVAQGEGDTEVFWDCGTDGVTCAEFARLDGLDGESAFIGNER